MTVLLFITTIVVFLTIDYFVRRNKAVPAIQHAARVTHPLRIPAGIFFTPTHTWLSLFPSGKVQLGVDDFLARMFSAPALTLLKKDHDRVRKGDPILRIGEGTNELTVRSPIDGTIESTNVQLSDRPEILNDALFSEGWAYTITPDNTNDLRKFSLGDDTRVWLRNEFGRLREFFSRLSAPIPAMMQDGGIPARGVMNSLNADQCKKFEREFLVVE